MMSFHGKPLGALLGATGLALALLLGGVAAPAQAEKVLRVANMGEPNTLDPHVVSGTWENRILGNMYLGLVTEAADGSDMAGAAESWTISDDGTTYTFKIRDHVWSDGKPVTADDFVFSLQRILDPATAAEYASLLYPIKNAEAVNTGKAKPAALGVKAIDAKTLQMDLEAATPYFLSQLTHYTAWPVPKHVVEKHGKDWTKKENIAVNGAFVLDEYVPNTHVKLSGNPKFFDAANVKLDRIIYYPGEDRAVGLKRFRAGEVDLAARQIIHDAGFTDAEFLHVTGHGLGFRYHEPTPLICPGGETVLEEGMVHSVEPGVYESAIGGIRIEDDILVTMGGAEILGPCEKEL